MPEDEHLFKPEEIARQLGVTERTIYNWLQHGKLKGHRIGKIWRVKRHDLDAFVREHSNTTEQELRGK